MDLFIVPGFVIADHELDESFARSSGPGGQHVNKTETKVELRWNPQESGSLNSTSPAFKKRLIAGVSSKRSTDGFIIVTASDHRSQRRNRDEARRKLARLLRLALVVQKPRKATKPTRGSNEKRLKRKKVRSQRKEARRWKGSDS